MATRRSIEIEGLRHQTAIPVATRIGPLLVSSIIGSFDPGTRSVPDDPAAQVTNIFRYVQLILDEAGASWEHVAKMEFWAPDADTRAVIDVPWVEHFPDEASRPSRHTHVEPGRPLRATFMAYVAD